MKKLLWLILIALLAVPTMAQQADAAYEPLIVSNVRLRLSEQDGASLVFNASPAVCAPLITDMSIDGDVIDVHVYAPPAKDNATCTMIVPFEPVLDLGQLQVDTSYKLFLNDFATLFFLPRPGGVMMDVQFPMTWGKDNPLTGFEHTFSTPDKVEFAVSDNHTITAHLTGNHPDGCVSNEYNWVHQDKLDSTLYHLDIFRLVPIGVMCPASLQPFDISIDTGVPADQAALFQSGDKLYSYDPQTMSGDEISRIFVNVESVGITQNGNNYDVKVTGTRNGNCGVDLRELLSETDYASFIQIFDDVPLTAACTMDLIPYDNTFTVSTLPVIVNGVGYDENGVIQVSSNAQAAGNPTEGNLMQVDTVIETVDATVLGSSPKQIQLHIKGYQPDGCEADVKLDQQQDGNNVTVHIYREIPNDVMCPMIVVPYEDTITLDGSFDSGTVNIKVNDFSTSVNL